MIIKQPWVSQPQVAADIDPSSGFDYAYVPGFGVVTGTNAAPVLNGSASIKPTSRGMQVNLPSGSYVSIIPAAKIPASQGTFLICGNAVQGDWGTATGINSERVGGHIPYSGTVYFDWGGYTAGVTRLSVAPPAFSNDDRWVFSNGPRGMEIWQNGKLLASQAANPSFAQASNMIGLGRYGANTGQTANYWFFAASTKQIPQSKCAELSRSVVAPWQIFNPIPRRIFVPVSAGSDVTITATLGNADATGFTADVAVSGAPVTINAALGTATASGLSATLAQAFSLSANLGTATASGNQATVSQAATISATLGTATASGLNASITAAGNVTISANLGTATASGNQATVNSAITISASLGAASAAGYTAALELAYTIAASIGTASATGNTATIFANESIACAIGTALASGYSATVSSTAQLTDSEKIDLILDILSNRQTIDPVSGLYTLYADDGTTVLKTALAWEDSARTIPYRGMSLQALDPME